MSQALAVQLANSVTNFFVKIFCENLIFFGGKGVGGGGGGRLAGENDFWAYLEGKAKNHFVATFLEKTFNLHINTGYMEGNQQTSTVVGLCTRKNLIPFVVKSLQFRGLPQVL